MVRRKQANKYESPVLFVGVVVVAVRVDRQNMDGTSGARARDRLTVSAGEKVP